MLIVFTTRAAVWHSYCVSNVMFHWQGSLSKICSFLYAVSHCLPLSLTQDNVLVLAATHRYKEKFVTTLTYKPVAL